jgi:hypothetical protein
VVAAAAVVTAVMDPRDPQEQTSRRARTASACRNTLIGQQRD